MIGPGLALLLLLLLALPLIVAVARSNQLFVIRVRAGRASFVRGRMPQSLHDEIADVVRGTTAQGKLIAVTDDGRARLLARGQFDPGQLQQLRNVLGMYPLARLRAGGRPRS